MIYRMHPDPQKFQQVLVEADEVERKLGEGCRFHLEKKPKEYAENWKPLVLSHFQYDQKLEKLPPELSVWNGKLFLSGQAYQTVKESLSPDDEVLPVEVDGGGYLVNILSIADDVGGVDRRTTVRNEWNELVSLGFDEENLGGCQIFRTKQDSYRGVYCTDAVKKKVEDAGLGGVRFSMDLSDSPQ